MAPTGNRLDRQPDEMGEPLSRAAGGAPATLVTPTTPAPVDPAVHASAGQPRPPAAPRARPAGTPAPRMKLSRRGVVVLVVLGLALLAGVAALSGSLTSGPAGAPPANAVIVARTQAASVTFDAAGGWLADDHAGTVQHFDPSSGARVGPALHLGGRPISVVAGFGRIWVADSAANQVQQINPATGKLVGPPVAVAQGPVSLAAGDGGIWVASLLAGAVSMIDPHTGQVEAQVTLPDGAVRIAVGAGDVWVSGQTDSLTRVDPRPVDGSLRWRAVTVGQGPIGVDVGDGSVWVANVKSGSVTRVDPRSMRVTATYPVTTAGGDVPANPEMVAVWHNRVWVADGQEGEVVALDPATGAQIGGPVALPGVVRQLVLDPGGTMWGTTANAGAVLRFSS